MSVPTYEYLCQACGHEFELFQAMSASVKRKCPDCGKLKLKRLIGIGSGVIFKGSGFYQTDYRSDSYKKAAEAEKKAAQPKTSTKGEKKTESKSTSDKKSDTNTSKSSD